MSQGSAGDEVVTVESEGITVRKRFVADEFPVPAIRFEIDSDRSDDVIIRVTDTIPESFSMERVGFHPDYENDNWTAYKDHRVEYRRALQPGESVTTVYGVRLDDPAEGASFLGEPVLERVVGDADDERGGESLDDVVGEDRTQVVREALAGDRESLPGMGSGEADGPAELDFDDPTGAGGADPGETADASSEVDADDPTASNDDDAKESVDGPEIEPLALEDPEEPSEVDERHDADETVEGVETDVTADESSPRALAADTTPAVTTRDSGSDPMDPTDPTADPSTAPTSAPTVPEAASAGVAEALAAEIRDGRVDDDDLALLRRELDLEEPTAGEIPASVDARIGHLQSKVDDLEAYSDALAAFLDEEGTGEAIIADLRERVETTDEAISDLASEFDDAASERADLRDAVEGFDGRLDTLDAATETNAEAFERLDEEMGDVRADLADLDGDVVALREELAAFDDELAEFRAFRARLDDVFGGA
ncbi:hypothetical protein [Halegenticoccus tardaugens]|uniref:hypothetical protein n=1 Tax=Halegenticoccus tardaugens TaxID=2071624 RepID=UPI00100AE2CC|nr:hypothetical protein [Halegenticoccus tardaugens]